MTGGHHHWAPLSNEHAGSMIRTNQNGTPPHCRFRWMLTHRLPAGNRGDELPESMARLNLEVCGRKIDSYSVNLNSLWASYVCVSIGDRRILSTGYYSWDTIHGIALTDSVRWCSGATFLCAHRTYRRLHESSALSAAISAEHPHSITCGWSSSWLPQSKLNVITSD